LDNQRINYRYRFEGYDCQGIRHH